MLDGFEKDISPEENIDKDESLSDEELIKESKNTLRYLRKEVRDRVSSEVQRGNEKLSNALQSLDKWLSWEKEKTHKEIHDDLDVLHDQLEKDISENMSKNPMHRSRLVVDEIKKSSVSLHNHILDEARKDPNVVASSIAGLMRYILRTEK